MTAPISMLKSKPIKRGGRTLSPKSPQNRLKRKLGASSLGKPRGRIKPRKVKVPDWIKCVPEGKHGSGSLQKRLWRLKSDFVRIRDWENFGTFIDTGTPIGHWNDAQAGHWRSWAECHGMFKYHEMNIHAQTAKGNSWPTSTTWENYKKNLIERYNQEFFDAIDSSNKNWPLKITTELVLAEIERTITMLGMATTKPPYWNRLMKLREMAQHSQSILSL